MSNKDYPVIKYSSLKEMLFSDKVKEQSNEFAYVTHYLQNCESKNPSIYKEPALKYFYKNKKSQFNFVLKDQLAFKIKWDVPFPPPKQYRYRFIDLFAGIGGFRLAAQKENLKCVFTSEIDINSQKTYDINFGEMPFGDITKINSSNIPAHDILLAGFPCQAFSIAGYRMGFEDTRGTLFFDIARILKQIKPVAFILENVKGLLGHDKGKTFEKMFDVLQNNLGYHVYFKVLNSMIHGNIPQNRERIFIVGFDPIKINNYNDFKFPNEIELTTSIHDLFDKNEKDPKYYYSQSHPYFSRLDKALNNGDTIYQWRRHYVRENKSNVCPTLTANMGTGGHNVPIIRDNFGIRKLTPRECARFQGIPESFILPNLSDSKLYYQIGNSVTVPLVRRIIKNILLVLN